MIRRPPRSTLFPTRRSSDLRLLMGYYRKINAAQLPDGVGKMKQFACWFTHGVGRSEEHTSELQSRLHLVCRLLLEKKKKIPRMVLRTLQHVTLIMVN